jgi:hypothetical protein
MKECPLQRLCPALILVCLIVWLAPYAGAAADSKIIEAAKKEGQLFWLSTIAQDQSQKLIDEFMKLYPFIKANYWRSGSVGLHNKILLEARAGRPSWDVVSQQLLAVGEFPLAIAYTHTVEWSRSQGTPVDWVNLEPVVIKFDGIMLGSKAANPNAAKLFIDFILSQAGQELLQSFSRVTLRDGVEPNPPRLIKGFKRIVLHPEKAQDAQQSLKTYRQIFGLP